ncbi:MAG TPA: hypothetical protein PLD20_24510 [Blastocatellia bacterium]|nr:hypothetical protein [Blastocatellia bacterium]HMZ21119.1 hypothetical protein [Blastocatellia bacterium]
MTKRDSKNENRQELTPAQLNAVNLLATGATVTAAAEAANVARQTVSEWMNHDPAFQASLNLRRSELWAEQCDRYRAMLPKALDAVETVLTEGGPDALKAALTIIRLSGLELKPTGETEAGDVEITMTERNKNRNLRRVISLI